MMPPIGSAKPHIPFLFNMFINYRIISVVNYFSIERLLLRRTKFWFVIFLWLTVQAMPRLMKHPVYGVRQKMFGTTRMSSRNPKFSEYAKVNFKIYIDSFTTPSSEFGDSGYSWNIKNKQPLYGDAPYLLSWYNKRNSENYGWSPPYR